jgi:ankyrin repeat protein
VFRAYVMQYDEGTALIFASLCGYIEVVECLLKHGANLDSQDKNVSRVVECLSMLL